MIGDELVLEVYPNFVVLARRCPVCGDRLIHNHTGIECGALHCEYRQVKVYLPLGDQLETITSIGVEP